MKTRNNSALLLVALLCAGFTVSCGGSGTLGRIKKDKVVYVVTVPFEAPLLYQRGQELVGPDAQLAARIIRQIQTAVFSGETSVELAPHWIERSYSGLVPALENAEANLIVGAFGITEKRKTRVYFSAPYYQSELVLIINPVLRDLRPTALEGSKLGVRAGAAVEGFVSEKFSSSEVIPFKTLDDAVLALKRGEIDGVIDDKTMAAYSVSTIPGMDQLEIVPGMVGTIPFAVALRPDDKVLQGVVDRVVSEVNESELYAQWLNEQLGDRLEQVETRYHARIEKERKAEEPRKVVIRVSKDDRNPFDIYRMANLRFKLRNQQSQKSYNSSRIRFQGRIGVSQATVPPGEYYLSLPKMNLRAGTVYINASDPSSVSITIRLQADSSIVVRKS